MILKISSIGVGECDRLSKFFRHSFPFQRRYTCNCLKLVRVEGSRDFAKHFRTSTSKEPEWPPKIISWARWWFKIFLEVMLIDSHKQEWSIATLKSKLRLRFKLKAGESIILCNWSLCSNRKHKCGEPEVTFWISLDNAWGWLLYSSFVLIKILRCNRFSLDLRFYSQCIMLSKPVMMSLFESGRILKGGMAFTVNNWAIFKSFLLAPVSLFSSLGYSWKHMQ